MSNHVMLRRVGAAQATLDEWLGQRFRWGYRDCVRLVASHLRRLDYAVRLPPEGSYSSARTALVKLRGRGFDTVAAALDATGMERIAPASAIVGDVIQGAADSPLGALGVLLGNGRLVAFHEHARGAAVLQEVNLAAAWRVIPNV